MAHWCLEEKEKLSIERKSQDLEEKMKHIFGTKVSINKKGVNKGKIEIDYYSQEELNRIIELFQTIKSI